MNWTGGCLCGSVRYEVSGSPADDSGYCHCRMCQRAYGSPFGIHAVFPEDGFSFTSGKPKIYKSSELARRSFCADCGTPLTFSYVASSTVGIMVGTLDNPEDFEPKAHSGIESQMPWLKIDDSLPRWRTEDDPYMIAAETTAKERDG